jgi:hypothetical protein
VPFPASLRLGKAVEMRRGHAYNDVHEMRVGPFGVFFLEAVQREIFVGKL